MVSSSLVSRRLNTISIFRPFDGVPEQNCKLDSYYYYPPAQPVITWIIEVKAPGADEVLGELGVGQQVHAVGHQLHIALGKLLQLEIYPANLKSAFKPIP